MKRVFYRDSFSRGRPRRFWVVVHDTGGVWPCTFAFHRSTAIKRFLAEQRKGGGSAPAWSAPAWSAPAWPRLRRDGFRVVAVNLARAVRKGGR